MENILIISLLSTFLFCLAKLLELRFLSTADDDAHASKPLKFLVRDAVIVFLASMASVYAYFHIDSNVTSLLQVITETKTIPDVGASEVFVGQPDF